MWNHALIDEWSLYKRDHTPVVITSPFGTNQTRQDVRCRSLSDAKRTLRELHTYFPQVARVVSLPQTVDELARRIETFWSVRRGARRPTTSLRRAASIWR